MYHQSSNMFFPDHSGHPFPPHDCPPPRPAKCPCECECEHRPPCCHEEENYYSHPHIHCPQPCNCHPCPPHPDCNCSDTENFYCRPGFNCCEESCCNEPCCASSMANALCPYVGKQVIICICGTRMRILVCEICGQFVKAIAISCGRTLYINASKIDSIKISC